MTHTDLLSLCSPHCLGQLRLIPCNKAPPEHLVLLQNPINQLIVYQSIHSRNLGKLGDKREMFSEKERLGD